MKSSVSKFLRRVPVSSRCHCTFQTAPPPGLSVPPANMLTPEIQAQPDGQLFNTVSNGVRQMPGYGHQIRDVLDRWAIVAYVRELQLAYGNPTVK